jgi:hypothetical protein
MERNLGQRLKKLLLRRDKSLGTKPSEKQLTAEEVAFVNSIPGVPQTGCAVNRTVAGARAEPPGKRLRVKTTVVESAGAPTTAVRVVPERTLGTVDVESLSSVGLGQRLSLRGLNIQWPFSQLILAGAKRIEVRSHALGDKPHIATLGEEMWLIETPGPSANANANAMAEGVAIGPRPKKAQIVGTATFSNSEQYGDVLAFHADAVNHCIREGGEKDWTDDKDCHAWRIAGSRSITKPIPAPEDKTMTGLPTPRSFNVVFGTCTSTNVSNNY